MQLNDTRAQKRSELRRKSNAEIVLKALLAGLQVKLGPEKSTYALVAGALVWVLYSVKDSTRPFAEFEMNPDPFYAGCDMTLTQFIRLCEAIPEDDIFILGAETVLNENKPIRVWKTEMENGFPLPAPPQ